MSAFRVGQKVCCIDAFGAQRYLREGEVYIIDACGHCHGTPTVRLTDLTTRSPTNFDGCGWFASRFRPLVTRKTSIEVFEKLLNTKSEKELV